MHRKFHHLICLLFFLVSLSAEAQTCTPSNTNLCLNQQRFRAEVTWRDFDGNTGSAQVVPSGSDDSGLFYFFSSDNWEMLLKVLDGCDINNRFWVFSAATTNVEYSLRITDTQTGLVKDYFNPLSNAADAITDTNAFDTCLGSIEGEEEINTRVTARLDSPDWEESHIVTTQIDPRLKQGPCTPGPTNLCLSESRFRVEVDWEDFNGNTGLAKVVPFGSQDSGLFYFFSEDNWEMLVKVLDGCGINDRFWVFSAATTNVKFLLKVNDTLTGATKTYLNPLGVAAPAITDTSAFATCSGDDGLPPDPGAAGDATLEGIDSDGDGIRDDIQRFIALNFTDEATQAACTQITRSVQDALVDAANPELSLAHADRTTRAMECLHGVNPEDGHRIATELIANIANTEERGIAHLLYNDNVGGQFYSIRNPAEWTESCAFSVSNSDQIEPKPKTGEECSTSGAGTTVYFTNGIWNTRADALNSCLQLASRMKASLPPAELEQIELQLAYNRTTYVGDLFKTYLQFIGSNYAQFFRMLAGYEDMPELIRDVFLTLSESVDETSDFISGSDLNRHVGKYSSDILEGRKVVVVAHSQGNFFANLAFSALSTDERKSYGAVAVATPAGFVAGADRYPSGSNDEIHTTLFQDAVIRNIPFALDPNANNEEVAFPGHFFVPHYLPIGSESLTQILEDIRFVRDNIEQPEQIGGEGVITVTLTWGPEPDVDLHVFEPNGEHVYYANRIGQSGFLDVDDVTSFGPEHYFASCETLEEGEYSVGVNYFRGNNPETATVLIEAGLQSRSFSIFLPEARGFGGDDDPVPVGSINVSGNAEDGYVFEIE